MCALPQLKGMLNMKIALCGACKLNGNANVCSVANSVLIERNAWRIKNHHHDSLLLVASIMWSERDGFKIGILLNTYVVFDALAVCVVLQLAEWSWIKK